MNDHDKWFDEEHYPADEIDEAFRISAPVFNNVSFGKLNHESKHKPCTRT